MAEEGIVAQIVLCLFEIRWGQDLTRMLMTRQAFAVELSSSTPHHDLKLGFDASSEELFLSLLQGVGGDTCPV